MPATNRVRDTGTHSDDLLMNTFVSLTKALKDWFDQPLAQLPDELRLRVEDEFLPMPWDKLTASGRRDVANQIDFDADPKTETYRQTCWEYAERRSEIEAEVKEWQDSATPTATDLKNQKENIQKLQRELAELEVEYQQKMAGFDQHGHPIPTSEARGRRKGTATKPDRSAETLKANPTQKQEPRKSATQKRHKMWQSEYRRLRKSNPNMPDTWYAKKIAGGPHAQGRSADTIRKNMKK